MYRGALPEASSAALAAQLLGNHTSPTQAAVRAERMLRLQEALNPLDALFQQNILHQTRTYGVHALKGSSIKKSRGR